MGGPNIEGPGWWTFDTALSRTFSFGEAKRLEFRAEAFNITNSTRLPNPTTNLSVTNTFGQITAASLGSAGFSSTVSSVSDPRIMQFALKYVF